MKAQVCDAPITTLPTIRKGGKVSKTRDEDLEVSLYLDKLRHLLPPVANSRKSLNKKVNRLEVIENVIQYISDLQDVLNIDINATTHAHEMDLLEYETSCITLAA